MNPGFEGEALVISRGKDVGEVAEMWWRGTKREDGSGE